MGEDNVPLPGYKITKEDKARISKEKYCATEQVSNDIAWLTLVEKVNKFKSSHSCEDKDIFIQAEIYSKYGEDSSCLVITGYRNLTREEVDQKIKKFIKTETERNKVVKEMELKLLEELKKKYGNEVHE